MGMVIHEMTHVLQNYNGKGQFWVQEGLADWARVHFYRDPTKAPSMPKGYQYYTQGYGVAAELLAHINSRVGGSFLRDLNASLNANRYNEHTTIAKLSGKSAMVWWKSLTGDTATKSTLRTKDNLNYCVDGESMTPGNGTKAILNSCNSGNDQDVYFVKPKESSFMYAHIGTKCIDVSYSGTTDGTPIHLWDCNGSSAQQWKFRSNDLIANTNSSKCLTAPSITRGVQLTINGCSGQTGQRWDTKYSAYNPPE